MRIFPKARSYCTSIWTGQEMDENYKGLMLSFMTPPKDHEGGIPKICVMPFDNDRCTSRNEPEYFELNQRAIYELRNWCERTLFALAHPDRYDEESSWRSWYPFTVPQRVGFTRYALDSCDWCIELQVEREMELERLAEEEQHDPE